MFYLWCQIQNSFTHYLLGYQKGTSSACWRTSHGLWQLQFTGIHTLVYEGAVKAGASAATTGDDASLWSMTDPKALVWVDFSLKFPIKGCGRFVSYSELTHRRHRKRRGDWLEWRVHIKAVSRELTRECQFIIQVVLVWLTIHFQTSV